MLAEVYDSKLKPSKEQVELNGVVFNADYNEGLIHQVVTTYLNNSRAGTKAQKTRSQVRGGGAKPWRQKGTGRARAGSIRSPIWRTGGKTFAATPKDYNAKINKKMFKGGLRSILSELHRQNRIIFVDNIEVTEPKTKVMEKLFADANIQKNEKVLIISDTLDVNLYLSVRNLQNKWVIDIEDLDPVSLIYTDKVIMYKSLLPKIEEKYL